MNALFTPSLEPENSKRSRVEHHPHLARPRPPVLLVLLRDRLKLGGAYPWTKHPNECRPWWWEVRLDEA